MYEERERKKEGYNAYLVCTSMELGLTALTRSQDWSLPWQQGACFGHEAVPPPHDIPDWARSPHHRLGSPLPRRGKFPIPRRPLFFCLPPSASLRGRRGAEGGKGREAGGEDGCFKAASGPGGNGHRMQSVSPPIAVFVYFLRLTCACLPPARPFLPQLCTPVPPQTMPPKCR